MPILISWEDNDKTIIQVCFTGDWTWADFPPIRLKSIEMLNSVDHVVDFIADFRDVTRVAKGAFSVGRSITNSRLKNEGIAVVVGTSPILRVLFHTFTNTYSATRNRYFYTSTLEEAHILIKTKRQNQQTG